VQDAEGNWLLLNPGESAQGAPKVTSKANDDGSVTLIKDNGDMVQVYTSQALKQQSQAQAQAWADGIDEKLFTGRPSPDQIKAMEVKIYSQLTEEQNAAKAEFSGQPRQGIGAPPQVQQGQQQPEVKGPQGNITPSTAADYIKKLGGGGNPSGQPDTQSSSPAPGVKPAASPGAIRREQLKAQAGRSKGGPTNATVFSGAGIDELPEAAKATGSAAVEYATKVGSLTKENFKFLNDAYQAFVGQPFESMLKSIVAEQGAQRKAMMSGAAIKALEKQFSDGNISPEQFDASYERLVDLTQ
jgi:hypothetical protein